MGMSVDESGLSKAPGQAQPERTGCYDILSRAADVYRIVTGRLAAGRKIFKK
jgi:hypothetical protein